MIPWMLTIDRGEARRKLELGRVTGATRRPNGTWMPPDPSPLATGLT